MSDDGIKPLRPAKWSFGVLNDQETDEVPGSVLLMPKEVKHNEPLGLRNVPARTSSSTLPSPYPPTHELSRPPSAVPRPSTGNTSRHGGDGDAHSFFSNLWHHGKHTPTPEPEPPKKTTANGEIVLDPQPDDSLNDPLNWASWRRDVALLSLGFYCMLGGGMTPVLAAGFTDVAKSFNVTVPQVALTTGLFMAGLGLGSVVASPTAILYGKRPVYLVGSVLFIASAVWCAASPSYVSLVIARIVMGISLSPVECLPSATIAEIFFLHERAYRLGIYTLLLLGGKNLIPLVSAAIIQALEWRWVFWIVAITGGFGASLLFFFVPETFWDRAPRPRHHHHLPPGVKSALSHLHFLTPDRNRKHVEQMEAHAAQNPAAAEKIGQSMAMHDEGPQQGTIAQRRQKNRHHVGFADVPTVTVTGSNNEKHTQAEVIANADGQIYGATTPARTSHAAGPGDRADSNATAVGEATERKDSITGEAHHRDAWRVEPQGNAPKTPALHNFNSPSYQPSPNGADEESNPSSGSTITPSRPALYTRPSQGSLGTGVDGAADTHSVISHVSYTRQLRDAPPKTFVQTLVPYNGRLRRDTWLRVAVRPFILFAYPAILWSTLVYSLSIGWLIVLSESVASVYRSSDTYSFSAIQTGLVYLSPFIGGVLGTAVAGKLSDVIVRAISKRNGGVYEPEFRLFMAAPVLVTTCIGLMGFGWSVQVHDAWIVPTVFFGVISFGCSLGSTTAITFAVDSYRQYAGEALVTLNFSKNIFHGLVFSLFFPGWLESDGSRTVFLAIGAIQVVCLLSTIPMYIFGKRARMWTVRRNMMERF